MKQSRRSRTISICSFSRFLAAAGLFLSFFALASGPSSAFADDQAAARRSAVKEQFARAEALRAALEAKPEGQRTLKDYTQLVSAYRRVMLITPRAAEVPEAIKDLGDLYRHMGEQFGREYFDSAIETYQFLAREYPASKYTEEVLLAVAGMQQDDLKQPDLARKSYEDFLKQYPRSSQAPEVRKALADIAAAPKIVTAGASLPGRADRSQSRVAGPLPVSQQASSAAAAVSSAPSAKEEKEEKDAASGEPEPSEVSGVRVWNADTYTRIVIDLSGQAKYQAARISDPDRIFFDIEGVKLSSLLLRTPIAVPAGGYLKSVRVAQNRSDTVRVVLDVTKVKDYSVFELPDPDRLVVDVYGPSAELTKINSVPVGRSANAVPGDEEPGIEAADATPRPALPPASAAQPGSTPRAAADAARSVAAPSIAGPAGAALRAASAAVPVSPTASNGTTAATAKAAAITAAPALPAKAAAADVAPTSIPERTRAGERSLTRALGLKIGHIVIDAGHGGHDTGTIGPSGLMEKDVCLDVALRLGKLIQQRLPAAEVTYTRTDDTFIPLEQRTAIANEAKADLFLSIHANSSDDRKVAGIETYYLNFNASPAAMEVATRENAAAQSSVHDLQDLVKMIARNEKIEESRDFATDIQEALTRQEERAGLTERNRGVRKAPFVVLIGADMPSVLAEISFLSNPSDEQWLRKPDNRQRIAEGLYRGIEAYLHSTNSLSTNAPLSAARGQQQ